MLAMNFSNPSHGNPLDRHLDLPEQKGARVTSRFVESPRTAPSLATAHQNSDDLERLVEDRERCSDQPEKSFSFRRKLRPTSSESRSRSVGNTVQLRSEYTIFSRKSDWTSML